MKIFILSLVFLSFNSNANENCSEQVDDIKHQAELFVVELNMDRVEMLFHIRGHLNIEGGLKSRQALDQELYTSIMEVLIKAKATETMVSRISKMTESFSIFPLQIEDSRIEELNLKLTQRLTAGK